MGFTIGGSWRKDFPGNLGAVIGSKTGKIRGLIEEGDLVNLRKVISKGEFQGKIHDVLASRVLKVEDYTKIADFLTDEISKAKSVDEVFSVKEKVERALTALDCYKLMIGPDEIDKGDNDVILDRITNLKEQFAPLLSEINNKLEEIGEREILALTGAFNRSVVDQSVDRILGEGLREDDHVKIDEKKLTLQFNKDLVERGASFREVTVGGNSVVFNDDEAKRVNDQAVVRELIDNIASFVGRLPISLQDEARILVQNLMTQSPHNAIVSVVSDPMSKSEVLNKLESLHSNMEVIFGMTNRESATLTVKVDENDANINVVIETEIEAMYMDEDKGKMHLAQAPFDIHLTFEPVAKEGRKGKSGEDTGAMYYKLAQFVFTPTPLQQ